MTTHQVRAALTGALIEIPVHQEIASPAVGDTWLANGRSALLRVSSAIMPDVQDIPFDAWLYKTIPPAAKQP